MRSFYFYWRPEGFFGILIVLHLLVLAFIIWMLVDAITRAPEDYGTPSAKTGWIVGLAASLLFPFPGFIAALFYLFSVRRQAPSRGYDRMKNPDAPPSPGTWTTPAPPPAANCRNCGAKIVAGARFCHSCGTPVE